MELKTFLEELHGELSNVYPYRYTLRAYIYNSLNSTLVKISKAAT